MHELSVTQHMLDIALEQAKAVQAKRVSRINVVIGEMAGVVDECVQFYFDFLSQDTIASGAILAFQRISTQLRCRNCATIFTPEDSNWACPTCHQWDVEIIAGRESYIDSIEVE
jgi:hydrogenase nickel incorporation protein HypA/HybF